MFRIGVKDVEAARDRLATMGVGVGPIERVEGVIAFFEFADPDGNHLSLYQVLELSANPTPSGSVLLAYRLS